MFELQLLCALTFMLLVCVGIVAKRASNDAAAAAKAASSAEAMAERSIHRIAQVREELSDLADAVEEACKRLPRTRSRKGQELSS